MIADFLADVHADHVRLGFRSGGCDACYRLYPEPEPTSWWLDAIAGELRPAIVDGVPTDTRDPEPGASDLTLSPQGPNRRVPPSAALAKAIA